MLSIYRAGEIDLFENLDIVHIRLLVAYTATPVEGLVTCCLSLVFTLHPHPYAATPNPAAQTQA